jgi:CheY-like chemotaxis protein
MMDTLFPDLRAMRLLVVEDEYLVADDIRHELQSLGAQVVGPAPSVAGALAMLSGDAAIDGAILDIDLCGEMVFPVAGALHARSVPFVFWTGYGDSMVPADFSDAPRLQKPATAIELVRALLRDIATPRPVDRTVLADLYLATDGSHLLCVRAGRDPLEDDALVWVGAAFIDAADWSRRLRAPVARGIPVRVPWRHLASLRAQLAMMG